MGSTEEKKQELGEAYNFLLPRFRDAQAALLKLIRQTILRIEDNRLVRAHLRDYRIKSFDSLWRKVKQQGLQSNKDACLLINDMVGARVVCNTSEDAYRFRELLRDVEGPPYVVDGFMDEQDYISHPKLTGYRALHLNFQLEVEYSDSQTFVGLTVNSSVKIPCEVQIRTLLQDSWAVLVHEDIYKDGVALPEDLLGRTNDLATLLVAADKIASRIRFRVMQETKFEPQLVRENVLTKEGLAHIFAMVFGRSASDYWIQSVYKTCLDAELSSPTRIWSKLSNKTFRDMLIEKYESEQALVPLFPEEILELTLIAVIKGEDKAVREAQRRGKSIWRDFTEGPKKELLKLLPESFEEFVDKLLAASNIDVKAIAFALDLAGERPVDDLAEECPVCGETIIYIGAFARVISEYYHVRAQRRLRKLLRSNASCWADAHLCSVDNCYP
jgi:putative GTP pyrophosphokinase